MYDIFVFEHGIAKTLPLVYAVGLTEEDMDKPQVETGCYPAMLSAHLNVVADRHITRLVGR